MMALPISMNKVGQRARAVRSSILPFDTYWDLVLKTTTVMALIRGGEIQHGVALAVERIGLCKRHGAFRLLERIYGMQQHLQRLTTSLERATAVLREALDGPLEY